MNANKNKPLASQLIRRIFTVYLAFAISLTLLQIYFEYSSAYMESAQFSVLLILTAFAVTTMGLWIIVDYFANRLLTKPLRFVNEQIRSFSFAPGVGEALPVTDFDSVPATELADLRESLRELSQSVAKQQAKMQEEALEEIKLAKSKFLAAAGHDLRQPMHALNLYLASLAKLEVSKPAQDCVDNLNKCAKAMNDMLDTLLDISNIDSGATQVRCGLFPIASPIDRIQAEFEPLARAKGLELRIARCSAFVYSDEEIVERVLRLLVSNAVRYTEQGKVLIGCRRHGEQLRLAVYDTGLGIASDKQQAIFEEHFQLNNYERNRAKGLGLGLTIAQRLAKLLETSITMESKPGVGSMFAIDLPQQALDAVQPATLSLHTTSNHHPSHNITVVVIDDEPLIRDATHALLECWGYTVITAVNGRDALEQLAMRSCSPDAIICDYLLEDGESGVNVIALLREAFDREIPALIVTGITLPDHIETMHASGLAYMYKPLDQEKLRAALDQLTTQPPP